LLWFVFLMIAIVMVWGEISMLFWLIFLLCPRIRTFFFMYLLAICTCSFENCLFSSFVHLFIGLLIVWQFSFLSSL
jgi:hypothetical protein